MAESPDRGRPFRTVAQPSGIADEVAPGFSIRVHANTACWTVECSGTLSAEDAATRVQSRLLRIHDTLVAQRVGRVTLDMHDVEYMNSSGIKGLITWFLTVENSVPSPYAIDLLYDDRRRWQIVSFAALQRIVPDVLTARPFSA